MAKNRTSVKRGQRGNLHPAWKGGLIKNIRGYVYQFSPDHPAANYSGYVFQHRLVMEKYLGRILNPQEVIHHINGIKHDNRLDNLALFSDVREHLKNEHKTGYREKIARDSCGRFIKSEK